MSLLPFGNLPPHRPRRFVPKDIDLGDWARIAPLFDTLEKRAEECKTTAEFEQWILDRGELSAAVDEEGSKRQIAMTCHTDDPEAEKAYLHFVEKVEPELKPRQFKLSQLYVAHPLRARLPKERYHVMDRDTQLHVELFRPENVPLETEEAKLGQQYQKLYGSLTVQFKGQEKTLAQMAPFFEEPDRAVRQEAWELVAKRRLQEVEKFEEIFDQLITLRQQIAKNAGFSNYRDYAFRKMGRFDYTPADCEQFHEAVEKEVMPVVRKLQSDRKRDMQLPSLRPWDLAVDPRNRPPLRPFQEVDQMVTRTQQIFDHLDRDLAQGFDRMRKLHLLDLANRKGKAPGGYQSTLSEARVPFIFMNAVGVQRDVETILHEAGHAFHALATRDEDLYHYRGAPIEFCEVASMSMEFLGNEFLEKFYSPEDANRARKTHIEQVIAFTFPWVATVDAFQHWIYTHPGHSRDERKKAWINCFQRFLGDVDWSGLDEAKAYNWHKQLHIFLYPFYYIEYGIAQLGAIQVWANSKRDKARALNSYKSALALGGSKPLPELFSAAGCKFDFSRKAVGPLIGFVREELEQLNRRADSPVRVS